MKRIFVTYVCLLLLLALSLVLYRVDLGPAQTAIALLIAATKATLVAWIFMELKSSTGVSRLAAASGLLWIAFFYILAALDVLYRAH